MKSIRNLSDSRVKSLRLSQIYQYLSLTEEMQHNPDSSGPPIRAWSKMMFFLDPNEVILITLEPGASSDTISSRDMRTEDRKGVSMCV